jgi:hypothetical protein
MYILNWFNDFQQHKPTLFFQGRGGVILTGFGAFATIFLVMLNAYI